MGFTTEEAWFYKNKIYKNNSFESPEKETNLGGDLPPAGA